MKKRLLALVLCLVLLVSATALAGCKKDEEKQPTEKTKILFLGDSIAEGIIGPSPLTEREDFAYYGIIGQNNDYVFVNQSVSGHQTKDMVQLLTTDEYYAPAKAATAAALKETDADERTKIEYDCWSAMPDVTANDLAKDDGAYSRITHIKNADIIHISIIGNDLLQAGDFFNTIILEAAAKPAKYDFVDATLNASVFKFKRVMQAVRLLNPDAEIILQSVYNPIYPNTPLLGEKVIKELKAINVTTHDELRALVDLIIPRMNKVISDYFDANKGSDSHLHYIDVYGKFKAIYDSETSHARGYDLFYTDGVHPSNEGHAVMADLIQGKLEEINLANKDSALAAYKALRVSQIYGIFKDAIGTNADVAKNDINACTDVAAVTEVFFNKIAGLTPKYGRGKLEQGEGRYFVSEKSTYRFSRGTNLGLIPGVGSLIFALLEKVNSGVILNTDGTMTIDLTLNIADVNAFLNGETGKELIAGLLPELDVSGTLDVGTLLVNLLSQTDEETGEPVGLDLTTFVNQYVYGLFPGFNLSDVTASIGILPASVGLGFVVDRSDGDGISKLIAAVEADPSNVIFPSDFTLPDSLTIRYSGFYYLKDVDTDAGKQTGIFVGKHDADSEPFLVMTKYIDEVSQKETISGRIEFIKTSIVATKETAK